MIDSVYFKQAELLLRILPLIDREAAFAMKGGTAINFFARDLPRISVDIDLVYLPVGERESNPSGTVLAPHTGFEGPSIGSRCE